jgi:hypothetical protein
MRRHIEAASARQGAADRGEYRQAAGVLNATAATRSNDSRECNIPK